MPVPNRDDNTLKRIEIALWGDENSIGVVKMTSEMYEIFGSAKAIINLMKFILVVMGGIAAVYLSLRNWLK